LLAAAFLLLATLDLPYGYYTFMRIVVCGISVYVAYQGYQWGQPWATWVFGLVAVLFNPLIPIHLSREIWLPIDLMVAGLCIVAAIALKSTDNASVQQR